jgi:hypothetical protein
MADETESYRVAAKEGRWQVLDESGRVIVVCRDENSATDYAVLLNDAYRRGYKAGFRGARQPG